MWHPYSVDLALCKTYARHANDRGRCANRKHRKDDGAFVYCQHVNQCPSHRPIDCTGYGEGDAKMKADNLSITEKRLLH